MLCLPCSGGKSVKDCVGKFTSSPHLTQVVADLDTVFVIHFREFNHHIESFTFLCITSAPRLEIVRKGCSNSKGAWNGTWQSVVVS